jgi:hypothetical protein
VTFASVEASLLAVAAPFAGPPANGPSPADGPVELHWGLLFALLDGAGDETFVEAIELIWEGYLVHYRSGRLAPLVAGDTQTALLAGDVFYARGLRLVAARGDVASVELLARLMSACSCLRAQPAPFEDDDALWAYTVAALAAVRHGTPKHVAGAFFDDIDAELAAGAPVDVPARAAAAAAALGLPDPAPLAAAFAALEERDAPEPVSGAPVSPPAQ